MTTALTEFRARQTVQTMYRVRTQIDTFTAHARTLRMSSASFDGLPLLEEAGRLLRALQAARAEFVTAAAGTASLSRSLPSRPPAWGGMPPAAKWGSEFRAGSRQVVEAIACAERELAALYGAANEKMNSVTRTQTGDPNNLLDIVLNLATALTAWIDHCRRQKS